MWTLAKKTAALPGMMIPLRPWQERLLVTGWLDRLPHHFLALAACVLAMLVGIAVADDYGVFGDTEDQRAIGEATLRHLAGERGLNLLWPPWNRLYGPIFETPLALIERILGRDDSRSIYLSRYLLSHLFFLAAGFACYLLAYRMFGSRWLAIFALLLFLLHPRIYAHSFFNSKDVPFLAMFMICLWLAHRAFGPSESSGSSAATYGAAGTAGAAIYGAFALCGVATGLLTNLRIAGLGLVAAVVLLRLFDVIGTRQRKLGGAAVGGCWNERRRAIVSGLLFALASAAAYGATMPYLWTDPAGRFLEILTVLSAHPTDPLLKFRGEFVLASELPWSYLPVWFAITTPTLTLLLAAVGVAALVWRIASRPGLKALLGNTPLRFELLIVACVVLPVLGAIVLRPTLYNGWRHFFFLWAPFVLLATSAVGALVDGARRRFRHSPRPWPQTVIAACLATLGLGAIAYEMVRLHPHQHLYFNALANRPGAAVPLRQRHYISDEFRQERGYAYILEELADREEDPDAVFNVWLRTAPERDRRAARLGVAMPHLDFKMFRERDRQRFRFNRNADPDFYVSQRSYYTRVHGPAGEPFPPVLYERKLYGQWIVRVTTPDLGRVDEATADGYRALYRDVTSGAPALSGDIDVYRSETAITWVKEPCAPSDLHRAMDMTVVPLDAARDRLTRRSDGVRVNDACLWQVPLPDYPIAKMLFPRIGALASDAHLEERRRHYAALSATPPTARSTFDVYLRDRTLLYVKNPCGQEDAEAPFFVHVRPEHPSDLPRARRGLGFDALDFRFGGVDAHWRYASGDIFDGICMAALELPDYPLANIATGQYAPGGASLWRVEIAIANGQP